MRIDTAAHSGGRDPARCSVRRTTTFVERRLMTARDPRIDPQPGDEVRVGPYMRRVLKREGAKLHVATGLPQYWIPVDRWKRWCEKSGAVAVSVAKQ